jgi:hypothetical protein
VKFFSSIIIVAGFASGVIHLILGHYQQASAFFGFSLCFEMLLQPWLGNR